jgi:hypothetical protein
MFKYYWFFNFAYTKDGDLMSHQFVTKQRAWWPDASSAWTYALEHSKQYTGAERVQCTEFKRV